jgi:lipoic acid synthetase
MDDMRCADIDFLTMGQVPSADAQARQFAELRPAQRLSTPMARSPGPRVSCQVRGAPADRSSYHAGDDFRADAGSA